MPSVKEKHPGEQRFLTHDNGGRPFLVYVGRTTATVYREPTPTSARAVSYEKLKDGYTKLVKNFSGVQRKFIPRYPNQKTRREDVVLTGNSILLELKSEYVFIGDCIYSFKPKEKITKYHSFVGNSDVPYPVAVGTEHVYFMLERKFVRKTAFPPKTDWEKQAYGIFYRSIAKKDIQSMPRVKMIQKAALY